MRRGGNDFLSVTIDLWSRPPVAVISARAAINSLGKPAKAKCVWARTEVLAPPPPSPWVSKGHGWTAFVPT